MVLDDRPHDERRVLAAVGILAVFLLLYGILINGQVLSAVFALAPLFFLYLVWRFVRAHERLAGATERLADSRPTTRTDHPE